MMTPFLMGTTSSITMQSLGKIVQRAPAVGAKMWCLFFCFFVTLRVRSAVRSRGAQFEHALRCHLQADFGLVCSVFFRKGLLFQTRYIVLMFVARWRQNFREIAVKNCEKIQKSAKKFVRTTSYRQLRDLKIILPQYFSAGTVDVHLCKNFPHVATWR